MNFHRGPLCTYIDGILQKGPYPPCRIPSIFKELRHLWSKSHSGHYHHGCPCYYIYIYTYHDSTMSCCIWRIDCLSYTLWQTTKNRSPAFSIESNIFHWIKSRHSLESFVTFILANLIKIHEFSWRERRGTQIKWSVSPRIWAACRTAASGDIKVE